MGYGPHRCFWKVIWKLKIPPKVRVFAWRIGHELLPTNVKTASFNWEFNCVCPRCGRENELVIHALRNCSKAHDVLVIGGIDGHVIDNN